VSAAATAQLVCLRPTPHLDRTIPSKLLFALAAGSPVLAGLRGEAADIAAESGGAVPFDSEDAESLAAAVRRVLALDASGRQRMSEALRRAYEERFARPHLLQEYVHLIYPDAERCE
jgi:colanic acid biosynthesis glycosyl transferase WcaI